MDCPRVLVFSNNCFSLTNSNGRTLGNFFKGWPKDKLAQFCLYFRDPNFDVCSNFYYQSDKEVLKSFFYGGEKVGKHFNSLVNKEGRSSLKKNKIINKTALKMLVRHFIWRARRWENNNFKNWIKEFNPEIVLVQSGDSAFMLQIAKDVAQENKIPLVFFNTEGFYFFRTNYMSKHWTDFIMFPLYQRIYRNAFRKVINWASYSIYGNQLLYEDYKNEFNKPSSVLYTSSNIEFTPKTLDLDNPIFSYMGNFGFNRFQVLGELANILNEINPKYFLNVYGNASDEVLEYFSSNKNIKYHGFINYSKVLEVINNSDILFHVESQNSKFKEFLRYGFSTKVADSLASGHNFLLYSSPNIACAQYVINNNCAWFAESHDDLKSKILEILHNKDKRLKILESAKLLSRNNHDEERNRIIFCEILNKVCHSLT